MLSFKLYAATHIGLRENNEDNFIVCPNLMESSWMVPSNHRETIQLGRKGCVIVVADGMGGQNAGEVASAIAVDTIKEIFNEGNLSAEVISTSGSIKSFLKKAIAEADLRIKKRTQIDAATKGMGSTIVIAWLIGQRIYIAWLGDSRAYSYIPDKGIGRITKDHSYVQQLVDANVLTDEEAMADPHSNIITRSLGDLTQKANPDVVDYSVENGEIILLCTDGLCGVCRDETIGNIISEHSDNLQVCKEALTREALQSGGSDNITIALLQIFLDSNYMSSLSNSTRTMVNFRIFKYMMAFIIALGTISMCVIVYHMTNDRAVTGNNASNIHCDADSSISSKKDKEFPIDNMSRQIIVSEPETFDSQIGKNDTTFSGEAGENEETSSTNVLTEAEGMDTVSQVN